ncbi:helix-turn-helix domain-containing protein [Streptomyces sp. NPDC000971]|uniref:helix-turn-helix domain-containing protein n=1 Tax=Streptomyces sp. NPDC000971 TaxID=3156647 RepID=UPI00332A95F8
MTRSTTGPAPTDPLPSPKERRRLREARELSERQVAAAVGVTAATVRAWETGRASPRGRRRAAYSRLIGCAEPRTAPSRPAEENGSGTMPTVEPDTLPAPDAPTPDGPTTDSPTPDGTTLATPTPDGTGPTPDGTGPAPQPGSLTAEEAYDDLYGRTAPGLTRQVFLLTGHRGLAVEAVEHAFRTAWQRWPEVATDRDPAGWVRAASYEYAMSPWHRLRRSHRRTDPPPEDPARRALLDAILGLPPSYRRTLLLHDGVGLGLPETAAETEASTHAAACRLLNARAAVAELLPAPADAADSGTGPAPLRGPLAALSLAEEVPAPPAARVVRARGERVAELWTRAALYFGVVLIGATAFTLHTAPTHYEEPLAPAERVGGVPPLGGPEKLTPQDLTLQKALKDELAHGPERLVPHIP